ncbi:Uncharacterised protein [Mycobacterium tuberculosis]|uniref:Uncharacterized protein n=1 Tax=Mycobacterium tuberculosis TaxID=1773 RepID=A0A0U0UVQ5_MYCTX|nr:Uncharacterised protein [Mycobacterium tuberculosis]CFE81475.1 Uncharacterised protein [Mycobacterium tuberculosis]COV33963.1 Uncharacterised protein [Mycobacterium tuberculosis]COW18161.1 Uncharacterised protein [Mycobacterium tuberculosis]COX38834.1 Uncharacterised protein [Mycobacterium tuberculosis]
MRRRKVIWLRARSCDGVSKYTASSCWVGDCSTRTTAAMPSNDGDTVDSITSNLRSTSRWRAGLGASTGIFASGHDASPRWWLVGDRHA